MKSIHTLLLLLLVLVMLGVLAVEVWQTRAEYFRLRYKENLTDLKAHPGFPNRFKLIRSTELSDGMFVYEIQDRVGSEIVLFSYRGNITAVSRE